MKKRLFTRLMAMVMAVTLLSTTAFAASFSALQDAIDGTGGNNIEGSDYKGYSWNDTTQQYGITAKDREDGTREVNLREDVTYDADKDSEVKSVTVDEGQKVELNMGGYTIDGGNEINTNTGELIGDKQSDSVILVKDKDSALTVNAGERKDENGETKVGTITGGYADTKDGGGGIRVTGGASLEMNGGEITKNGVYVGGYAQGGGGVYVRDSSAVLNNVNINHNTAGRIATAGKSANTGGGVMAYDNSTLTINGGKVQNNMAIAGGGIGVVSNSKATISNAEIMENESRDNCGGIYVVFSSSADIKESVIARNKSQDNWRDGHGIFVQWGTSEITWDENTSICNNGAQNILVNSQKDNTNHHIWGEVIADTPATCHSTGIGHRLCKSGCREDNILIDKDPANHDGETEIRGAKEPTCTEDGYTGDTYCTGCGELIEKGEVIPAKGHTHNNWVETTPAQPGVPGVETEICPECGEVLNTRPIPALPMPIDFGDGTTGGGDTGTAIADEETPLAGLFTRADAVGYLWEHTGSPEAELSTFADVPEDHYWAVAIGWAEDMGIAVADEDGNFRPDDLVLRSSDEVEGELQEFLNRYAVFSGVELEPDELFIELDSAADDVIMGEDAQVIFDTFFAKLEKALAGQEKAA